MPTIAQYADVGGSAELLVTRQLGGSPTGLAPWIAERTGLSLAVVALFGFGYFEVGHGVDIGRAHELTTALDEALPFIPESVFVYLAVFPLALLPLFVVRSPELFRRAIAAYILVILVSLIIFWVLPVTAVRLRPDVRTLEPARFAHWCVAELYRLDPPVNLFPSLHLSIAGIAAAVAYTARPGYGVLALIGVGAIGAAVCMTKQHFVIDVIGGLFLAGAAYLFVIRPFRPGPGAGRVACSWQGALGFGLVVVATYAGLYVAFRASTT